MISSENWDTRRSPRVPVCGPVRVRVHPTMQQMVRLIRETQEVDLFDISAFGIGVSHNLFLPKGTLLNLQLPRVIFMDPGSASLDQTQGLTGIMRITGQIVYTRPEGALCIMGIVFKQIDEADQRFIDGFISQNSSNGILKVARRRRPSYQSA